MLHTTRLQLSSSITEDSKLTFTIWSENLQCLSYARAGFSKILASSLSRFLERPLIFQLLVWRAGTAEDTAAALGSRCPSCFIPSPRFGTCLQSLAVLGVEISRTGVSVHILTAVLQQLKVQALK